MVPIHKKGDKRDPSNYRGISLISVIGKLFCSLVNTRLQTWVEANSILSEEQGGFRPKRGCPDQLFILNEIIPQKCRYKEVAFLLVLLILGRRMIRFGGRVLYMCCGKKEFEDECGKSLIVCIGILKVV